MCWKYLNVYSKFELTFHDFLHMNKHFVCISHSAVRNLWVSHFVLAKLHYCVLTNAISSVTFQYIYHIDLILLWCCLCWFFGVFFCYLDWHKTCLERLKVELSVIMPGFIFGSQVKQFFFATFKLFSIVSRKTRLIASRCTQQKTTMFHNCTLF